MAGKVLIVGGGIGGMCCAITLGRIGCAVDLIDIDPHWRALGAGLTIGGAALRAFRSVGVLDEVRAQGALSETGRLVRWTGEVVSENALPPFEPGLAAIGGILRPTLHAILARHVRDSAAAVRLGLTVTSLDEAGDTVRAVFSDGSEADYDGVIGADSLTSAVRRMMFPDAPKPSFTGQGCWRLVVPRGQGLEGPVVCADGPNPVGLNPISRDKCYMYLLTPEPDNRFIPHEAQLEEMRGLLAGAGGVFGDIHDHMDESYLVNYRPLEWLLMPKPWSRGRVVLVGDAAHATTPHVGYGAGLAVEDAVVLADELARDGDVPAAFERFTERRFERAKFVIETSVQLGQLEMTGRMAERRETAARAQAVLQQPI
jgi:2-polyprenyl-6-methoxyphenol hydroxylase-like FAD-dependent oxidoreductase